MDENILADDLVHDAIRLEVNLPVRRDADAIQLAWDVAAQWQLGETQTQRFKFVQDVVSIP